jgi:hypothetical protein
MKKYFLDTDNDSHWHLIEAERREDWENWCELDTDDESSWNVPDFAHSLGGGPNCVEFEFDPKDLD